MTNGVSDDTTKSKEVSNTVNALDAIGFVNRDNHILHLTEQGKRFAETPFDSKEMNSIIRNAVLNYGLFVGLLGQIFLSGKQKFKTNEIYVGYPNSDESIFLNNETVLISSGSEKDSNTRTKSCLLAWGTTSGFFAPIDICEKVKSNISYPQIAARQFLLSKNRSKSIYTIIKIPDFLFDNTFVTKKPLDYKNLTKNTGALRENNQEKIRELTLQIEHKIQNRRYAIIFALNLAFINNTYLNIDSLIKFLENYPDKFIVNHLSFHDIIYSELTISVMVGIPFKVISSNVVKPLSGINLIELNKGLPGTIKAIMQKFRL